MSDDKHPSPAAASAEQSKFPLRRFVPLVIVVAASALVLAMGWQRQLSFGALMRHYEALRAFVGATIGAICIFLIAKSAIGDYLVRRAGPLAQKLARGFRADAFSYLLFLRLVPIFPFWIVNLVPALVGVKLRTFAAATAIGIIPATFVFAFVGAGLDSVIAAQQAAYQSCLAAARPDCRLAFHIDTALTPELLVPLVGLGVLALVPVLVRRLRARSPAAACERADHA